jgi:hypothetical protein
MSDGLSRTELEQRIAEIRQNISQLVEQAAGSSGAADETRTADRIADLEEELRALIKRKDAMPRA